MAAERTYTIPLRREWLKAPKYRRAKKAVAAVKQFLIKHMKSEDIRLGKHLNEEIWKNGIKNPPGKVKINVLKDDKNIVRAELFGKKIDTGEKKEEKTSIAGKLKEKIVGKKVERPKKKAKEEKAKKEEEKTDEKRAPAKEEKVEEKKEEKPAVKEKKKEELKKEPAAKEEKPKAEVKEETKKAAPKEEKPAPENKPAEK